MRELLRSVMPATIVVDKNMVEITRYFSLVVPRVGSNLMTSSLSADPKTWKVLKVCYETNDSTMEAIAIIVEPTHMKLVRPQIDPKWDDS